MNESMNEPMNEPSEPTSEPTNDADRFRRTLVKVMTVQVIALLLLWWLQAAFTA